MKTQHTIVFTPIVSMGKNPSHMKDNFRVHISTTFLVPKSIPTVSIYGVVK